MATVKELVASTGLPAESRRRLDAVMRQLGYAEGDVVDSTVLALAAGNLETAASEAGLDPPPTYKERTTLLHSIQPPGKGAIIGEKGRLPCCARGVFVWVRV